MRDPSTPAGFRLKAALAAHNQTWSLPDRVESLAQQKVVDQFALAMAASAGEFVAPEPSSGAVARNAPCPCSSGKNTNVAAVKTPRGALIRGFGQRHDPVFTPIKDNSLGTETRSMYTSGQAAQMLLMAERQNRSRSTISTKSARRMGSHGS
jgi:hypothetical protein